MEHQFRVQCVEAARQLSDEDVHVLQYVYRIKIPSTSSDTTVCKALYVFERLEEDGRLRPNNDGEITLLKLLYELPRRDIVLQLFGGTKTGELQQEESTIASATQPTNHRYRRHRGNKDLYLDPNQKRISSFFKKSAPTCTQLEL